MNRKQIAKALEQYDDTLRAGELISFLKIGERTFYELLALNELPYCVKIGKRKRWLKETVIDWLLSRFGPAAPSEASVQKGKKSARAKYGVKTQRAGRKTKEQLRIELDEGLAIERQLRCPVSDN